MKEPKCKHCGGKHYSMGCFKAPRKALTSNKPFKASTTGFKRKAIKLSSKVRKPLKRTKMSSKSKNPRSILISKLDSVYSHYIRRRDTMNDIATCVTCNFKAHWRELQCGHYISRRKMSVRFDERNTWVQCPNCNEALHGNLIKYKEFLIHKIGEEELNQLHLQANKAEKLTAYELEKLLAYYTEQLKALDK